MTRNRVFKNLYRDSVTLMQLSARLEAMEGISMASALMGTPANQTMMVEAGLLEAPLAEAAPNDLVLVVQGEESVLDEAIAAFDKSLNPADAPKKGKQEEENYASVAEALRNNPEANLALISVPGEYAGAEAMKALRRGLNVMLFSDNVPLEQEIALKKYATEHGLLVMGPDCGTAIISGAPLAFANVVRRGKIGVIGASGTGTQEVTSQVDQLGQGISQAIGTGGHDLSVAVGGLTMRAAIKLLAEDSETEVITLISKPPAKEVAEAVLEDARQAKKPVVVCFLGATNENGGSYNQGNLVQADSLEEAAHKAAELAQGKPPAYVTPGTEDPENHKQAVSLKARLKPGQKYLRGLYSGGTFCYEALLYLQKLLPGLSSNTPTGSVQKLADIHKSVGHTVIDLGDDDFTRGKPHPMIDPSQRNQRLLQEADDPETAVVLLDVVLGYGANPDPAGELAQAVAEAKKRSADKGRDIVYIGFICGTEGDPQNFREQRAKLEAVGIHLCTSNIRAVTLAGSVLTGLNPAGHTVSGRTK